MINKEIDIRLIDANALKDRLAKHQSILNFEWNYDNLIASIIDNAPTVEIPNYGSQIVPDNLQGWKYEERPHGEWNYIQADMCICPFCGAMPHKLYKNYCAKCGADMRKGKGNE